MIPPAALCIHLCIGQAYAFSVFNLPMTKLIGITNRRPDDWKLTDLGWIFSIAIFFLGASAAVLGRWVEEGGPRRAMFTAALCFGGGFLVSASASICTISGSSISATACSAASGSGSATSRRSRR
jgi:MFS family permease